jgi:hypothetical protein
MTYWRAQLQLGRPKRTEGGKGGGSVEADKGRPNEGAMRTEGRVEEKMDHQGGKKRVLRAKRARTKARWKRRNKGAFVRSSRIVSA